MYCVKRLPAYIGNTFVVLHLRVLLSLINLITKSTIRTMHDIALLNRRKWTFNSLRFVIIHLFCEGSKIDVQYSRDFLSFFVV